mgnify:CR=1 FL=1
MNNDFEGYARVTWIAVLQIVDAKMGVCRCTRRRNRESSKSEQCLGVGEYCEEECVRTKERCNGSRKREKRMEGGGQ